MSRQVLTSTYLHGIVDRYADLAQLAERIHGKDEVAGSIPAEGSRKNFRFDGSFFMSGKNLSFSAAAGIPAPARILLCH